MTALTIDTPEGSRMVFLQSMGREQLQSFDSGMNHTLIGGGPRREATHRPAGGTPVPHCDDAFTPMSRVRL